MFKKSKRGIYLTVAASLLLIVFLVLLPKLLVLWSGMSTTTNSENIAFLISSPTSPEALSTQLEKAGLITDKEAFLKVASYKNLNKNRIAVGMYEIQPHTSFRTLLNGFTMNSAGNGNAEVEVPVTFNNCKTIYQMAGKVSACLALDSSKLISHLLSGSTLTKYGFTVEQLPALFIPNTYKLYYDTDEKAFTQRMADEFKLFWTEVRKAKMKAIGLNSPSEVTTLASIVYAEQSVNADEWPTNAGLYLNRVRNGMKLQSDPTFKFCWGDKLDGVQRLLAVHRNIVCPYNTYLVKGLPPGPINLPSTAVLDAVLNAPRVD
ncbi:MAG: endolytic transglycosylase MltG, partial [Flavobacteriales bacterium]